MATETRGGTRKRVAKAAPPEHHVKMLAYVLKAEVPVSRQIEDPFASMYGEGLALEPDLDPERLLILADESAAHGACLDAKADDTVGGGWTLSPSKSGGPDPDTSAPDAPPVGQPDSAMAPEGEADATIAGSDVEEAVAQLEEELEAITPDYSFAELLWQAAWERDAIGWSGWEMVNGTDGKIGAIYPMPGQTIRATKDRDIFVQVVAGVTRYFARFGSGKRIDAFTGKGIDGDDPRERRTTNDPAVDNLANEVLIFRGYSSRNRIYPIPRWVAAIPAIAELAAIREFNVSFFGSGGLVDRSIHVKAGDETAAKALAEEIQEKVNQAASSGAGHLTIVTGGDATSGVTVGFLTPTQGRRDGQFGGRRGELTDEVLMSHKVPGYRVTKMVVGSLGGAPTRETLHTYRKGVIEPAQGKLEHVLNPTLFGPTGLNLVGFRWALEDLDWDETELDLKIATDAVDHGLATPDEGREIIGLGATGEDKMTRYYYKGVEVGSPRSAQPGPPDALGAVARLDSLRQQARERQAAKPAPAVEPSTNGHSTEELPTVPVA